MGNFKKKHEKFENKLGFKKNSNRKIYTLNLQEKKRPCFWRAWPSKNRGQLGLYGIYIKGGFLPPECFLRWMSAINESRLTAASWGCKNLHGPPKSWGFLQIWIPSSSSTSSTVILATRPSCKTPARGKKNKHPCDFSSSNPMHSIFLYKIWALKHLAMAWLNGLSSWHSFIYFGGPNLRLFLGYLSWRNCNWQSRSDS